MGVSNFIFKVANITRQNLNYGCGPTQLQHCEYTLCIFNSVKIDRKLIPLAN